MFDTSGFDVYLGQKQIYDEAAGDSYKGAYLLKKVYEVKVPGLNTILDKYSAPHGINILKDQMKKKFGNP